MGMSEETVTVRGVHTVELPRRIEAASALDLVTREITFECASGRLITAVWEGLPLSWLFEAAAMSADTTHLVFESSDGYQTCIPVVDLFEGVLAYDADDETMEGFPRVVSPSVAGPRASKDVVAISPVALEADVDAAWYEALGFDES